MSMSSAAISTFEITLTALSKLLDKAEAFAAAKKFDAANMLASRLAPDMFALARQVQVACDLAKFGAARLAGIDPPKFEDNETTMDELLARVKKTLEYIETVPAAALEGSETRDIRIPLRDRTVEFKGLPFLQAWALPNFFFHYVTAYNLLRHNGVDIGKRDFLGS